MIIAALVSFVAENWADFAAEVRSSVEFGLKRSGRPDTDAFS